MAITLGWVKIGGVLLSVAMPGGAANVIFIDSQSGPQATAPAELGPYGNTEGQSGTTKEPEVVEVIRIRWTDIRAFAKVVHEGSHAVAERRRFVPQGDVIVAEIPPNCGWTFCLLNGGNGLTKQSLARLCRELKRVRAPGLEVTGSYVLDDDALRMIAEVESLRDLVLGDGGFIVQPAVGEPCRVTAKGLRQLAALPMLERLYFQCFDYLDDEDYASIVPSFAQLRSLGLQTCLVDSKTVEAAARITDLRSLALRGCEAVGDDDLKPLASKETLRNLDLYDCDHITGRFAKILGGLRHLESLNIGKCKQLEGEVLEWIGTYRALEYLDITGLDCLTADGLATVRSLPKLHTLVMIDCRDVDDDMLEILAGPGPLTTIYLRGTKVTESGISRFLERNPKCTVDRSTRYSPKTYR